MHRPPHAALHRLLDASVASDRDLDRALADVGVLPPLDLSPIRHVLNRAGTELGLARNRDGHVIVEVAWNAQVSAFIHHDGRVHVLSTAAA